MSAVYVMAAVLWVKKIFLGDQLKESITIAAAYYAAFLKSLKDELKKKLSRSKQTKCGH